MLDRLDWTDLPASESKSLAALVLFQGNDQPYQAGCGRLDVGSVAKLRLIVGI